MGRRDLVRIVNAAVTSQDQLRSRLALALHPRTQQAVGFDAVCKALRGVEASDLCDVGPRQGEWRLAAILQVTVEGSEIVG